MASPSNLSDKKPFALLSGHGEEITSFIGRLYLPSLPGTLEARAEKSERAAQAFGTPGREVEKAFGLAEGSLGRAAQVARFFSSWESALPDLSRSYFFISFEKGRVRLGARPGAWIKGKRFDEAEIEKALNERMGGSPVKVKIVQNFKK